MIYFDPHNVSLGSTSLTGVLSISVQDTSSVVKSRSDEGTFTRAIAVGDIEIQMTFDDELKAEAAAKCNGAAGAGETLTFDVNTDVGTDKRHTITNVKTGGHGGSVSGGAPGQWAVSGSGDGWTKADVA